MKIYKDNFKLKYIPFIYLKLLVMSTEKLFKLYLNSNVHPTVLTLIYSILFCRNNFDMKVYESFKDMEFSKFMEMILSNDFQLKYKKEFLTLYRVSFSLVSEWYDNFFNTNEISDEIKHIFIVNNKDRFDIADVLNIIKSKKLRFFIYENIVKKENVLELFNNKKSFGEKLYKEFVIENINKYYEAIKNGNTKKLLMDALFVYKDEVLYSHILKIKNLTKNEVKKYIDKEFALKALEYYKESELMAYDFVNKNYAEILNSICNIRYADYKVLFASSKGMEILLDKSKIKSFLNKMSVNKVVNMLDSSSYSDTLLNYLVSVHHKNLVNYYSKMSIEVLMDKHSYLLVYENLCLDIFKNILPEEQIIFYLNELCNKGLYIQEKDIINYIKANKDYFKSVIEKTNFNKFSFYGNQKINSIHDIGFKLILQIFHDDFLNKYKELNNDALIEIIYNEKEKSFIKDIVYEVLFPDNEDRENVKNITTTFGYEKAINYYNIIKSFLDKINFDKKIFIQYGLENNNEIYIMNTILDNNELEKFMLFKNFIDTNFFSSSSDAEKVENLCKQLINYFNYKDLFNSIQYDKLSTCDIKNIYLLVSGKLKYSLSSITSLQMLDEAIKDDLKSMRSYVNSTDSLVKLNQILIHLTTFNGDSIDILINNIGGITGLETLRVNNSDNEKLCSYIDELVKIVRIKKTYISDIKILKFILNKILDENDNLVKDIYTNYDKIYQMVRKIFEMEANYNLTKIQRADGLINKELTDKYGVKTYDFSKVNYALYAHVKSYKEPIDDLVNGISNGRSNYISLSPISYLGQKYYFDEKGEIFLYDSIPEGSYLCSGLHNMATNSYLSRNTYYNNVIPSMQRGLLETSSVSETNSETLLYRNGLKPVAIALIGGKAPSQEEIKCAKKYNLSFVITQKYNEHIEKPINYFTKEVIKKEKNELLDSTYNELLKTLNYHKNDTYTGKEIMIISDIHAFLEPAVAVLSYAKTRGIEKIYSLGDNITVGPSPLEVLELLEKYNVKSIEGNSESYFLNDYRSFTYFDKEREDNCNWTLDKIGSRVNDLKFYPVSREILLGSQDIALTHFINDVRWDYTNHNTWIFQQSTDEDIREQFLYTNSVKAKEDMQKIIERYGYSSFYSKIVEKSLQNPILFGKMVTDFNHIFQGHVHFEFENKVDNTFIHTIKMIFRDDLANAVVLKEKNDGTFDIEKVNIPFNKQSMLSKINSSDMPSKDKALMYVRK